MTYKYSNFLIFFLIIYNFSLSLALGFLFYNFQIISAQLVALQKLNAQLVDENIKFRQILIDRIPEVINPAAPTWTDGFKILLIKLAVILVVLSFFGACTYLAVYFLKAWAVGFFEKTVYGYLYAFLSYNQSEKITYIDKLNNTILVHFTDKEIRVDIKPFSCENFISLDEFFLKHPDQFKELLQASIDTLNSGAVQSSVIAPTVETLSQFIDKMF